MQRTNKTSDLSSDIFSKTRNTLGERLRELWTESGVKQEEFAKRLGITTVTLANYMKGARKPDSDFLLALSTELNICLDWLVAGRGSKLIPTAEPPTNQTGCPRCAQLEEQLNSLIKEQTLQSQELREINAENRSLWRENGELRETAARLEERKRRHNLTHGISTEDSGVA